MGVASNANFSDETESGRQEFLSSSSVTIVPLAQQTTDIVYIICKDEVYGGV